MPESAMLDLARAADNGRLAITFDDLGIAAQRVDEPARQIEAKGFEHIHVGLDIRMIGAGERIPDDGKRRSAPIGGRCDRPTFMEYLFDRDEIFSDLQLRHGSLSSTFLLGLRGN